MRLRALGVTVTCVLAFATVTACGGRAATPAGAATSDGGVTREEPCPNVDYCALRCSPNADQTPLYPPHCTIPVCSCLVGVQARNDWSGTYTLERSVDAINVTLEPDGTFHWTLEACDARTGDCGEWRKSQPHVIVLLPAAGRTSFTWPSDSGGDSRAQLLVTSPDGRALAVEHPQNGEKPLVDRWTPGRTCATCSSSGITKSACNAPVERRCR